MVNWTELLERNPEPSLLDAIEWADPNRPLAVGDLVYVVGSEDSYRCTRDGSWGRAVIVPDEPGPWENVGVEWECLTGAVDGPLQPWEVAMKYLRRIDNPPKTPKETTALVSVLIRIGGAL